MPFSDLPEHLYMPALRQFQAWPMQKDGKQLVALREPFMLTKETLVIPAGVFAAFQFIDGESTVEEIIEKNKGQS